MKTDTFPVNIRLQIKVEGFSILVTVPGSDWFTANGARKQALTLISASPAALPVPVSCLEHLLVKGQIPNAA